MTTPADWNVLIPQLKDAESIRFAQRLVQYQREWLDIHAAQLDEIAEALKKQEAVVTRKTSRK